MKRIVVLTTVSALILGLALTALAQRKKARMEEPEKKVENAEQGRKGELNLSDEQKQKLAAIHRQEAKERIRLNAERQIARIELQELLQSDRPDQAAVDRKIDQLADLNRQMTQNRLHSLLASRSVLTKEQWAALHQKMEKRMMTRGRERMKILRFRGLGRGFGPEMGPGYPMGDESLDEEAMPEEAAGTNDFDQLGAVEEPDFDMDFHPFEAEPEIEMNIQTPAPSEEGWQ